MAVRILLVLIGVVGLVSKIQGTPHFPPLNPTNGANQLIYLGRVEKDGKNGRNELSDYYVSVNPTTWNVAEADCKQILGKDRGQLLEIDTEDEMKTLRTLLETFGSGKIYWTGGIYNPPQSKWLWATSGTEVGTFAVPPPPPNGIISSQDRIVLYHGSRFDSHTEVLQDSQPQRYVCEVKNASPPCP